MRPLSSAIPRNSSGTSSPRSGMLPPCERLEGLDPAGLERDDRLVVDDDLVALERAPQLAPRAPGARGAAGGNAARRSRSGCARRPSRRTSRCRRCGGAPRRVTAFSPVSAIPMLASRARLPARQPERLGERVTDPLRDELGVGRVRVREQDGELVAAEAGRRVARPRSRGGAAPRRARASRRRPRDPSCR